MAGGGLVITFYSMEVCWRRVVFFLKMVNVVLVNRRVLIVIKRTFWISRTEVDICINTVELICWPLEWEIKDRVLPQASWATPSLGAHLKKAALWAHSLACRRDLGADTASQSLGAWGTWLWPYYSHSSPPRPDFTPHSKLNSRWMKGLQTNKYILCK